MVIVLGRAFVCGITPRRIGLFNVVPSIAASWSDGK